MITQEYIRQFAMRMRGVRTRLLTRYPFFGMLMMNLRIGLDEDLETAATNGEQIVFDPKFLGALGDDELDFIVMHELMHIALDHLARAKSMNNLVFNVACDIVVNSNIMHMMGADRFIVDGEEVMHTVPDGSEGYLYSAEEVYRLLHNQIPEGNQINYLCLDVHDAWRELTETRRQELREAVSEALSAVGNMGGGVPGCIVRKVGELRRAQVDWREVLARFVQEDVLDYSFTRPDKRYGCDVIMPGFVYTDETVRNVLFMIDTSGSMMNSEIAIGYSEICGALEMFGGRLSGLLGFFDSAVTPPVPFETVEDVLAVKPSGGGGTSVKAIFDYVRTNMKDDPPVSIVILTDGWAYIPDEECSDGIPVLWLLTCKWTPAPKWGTVTYLEVRAPSE